MNKTSVYLRVREGARSDGNSALYLSITVNSVQSKLSLNIYWPEKFVDKVANNLKAQKKDDKNCADYNLMIATAIGKLNDIFIRYRLSENVLSLDQCMKEYNNFENRNSFIDFMEKSIDEKYRSKIISFGTTKVHKNALGWLVRYKKNITFADLTPKVIEGFNNYLKTKKSPYNGELLSRNTVSSINKTFKVYCLLAQKKNLIQENPFAKSNVKISEVQTVIEYLLPNEVKLINDELVNTNNLGEKISILRFLIACNCSLRISDIMKLDIDTIEKHLKLGQISIMPIKTQNKGKIFHLNIGETLQVLLLKLKKEIELKKNNFSFTEQFGRRVLKKIAIKVGINKKINFHTGRHTFATNYMRAGGRLEELQKIMCHSSILTTMKYRHIVDSDIIDGLAKLESFMSNSEILK